METNTPSDPVEMLTATPASIRRLSELTLILREQLPAALDRLELDTRSLTQAAVEVNQASQAMHGLPTKLHKLIDRLVAQTEANLNRLADAHLQTLIAYSRAVTVLLVSQAVLIATMLLMLWIRH